MQRLIKNSHQDAQTRAKDERTTRRGHDGPTSVDRVAIAVTIAVVMSVLALVQSTPTSACTALTTAAIALSPRASFVDAQSEPHDGERTAHAAWR